MNLFDDDGFNEFDSFDGPNDQGDFGFDDSSGAGDFGSDNDFNSDSGFDNNNQDFSNSDDVLNTGGNPDGNENAGSIKKTAIIMIAVGIVVVIGVLSLARVVINKDKQTATKQNTGTNVSTQVPVQQTTVNAQELMGNNNQSKPVQNNSTNQSSGDSNYWININGQDQMVFGEPIAVQFHITGIKHYIANAEGSDNYVVKSTLSGSLAGYSGTFQLDVPYDKGTLLQVGQEFTVYITVGSWNGKTVIGEIKY